MILKISFSGGVHLYNTTCNSACNYFSSPLKDFMMYSAGKKVGRNTVKFKKLLTDIV
jgi:hypothetical protein